jgi:hypothetical protein
VAYVERNNNDAEAICKAVLMMHRDFSQINGYCGAVNSNIGAVAKLREQGAYSERRQNRRRIESRDRD